MRNYSDVERIPLDFDNTYDARMRGDYAVPTLVNGNFDAVFQPKNNSRNLISKELPGWSFHNGATSTLLSPTDSLVDLKDVPSLTNYLRQIRNEPSSSDYQTNYALKLKAGESIIHNRFVVPDWGALRFDLHVPNPQGGEVKVSIKGSEPGDNWQYLSAIKSQSTTPIQELYGVQLVRGNDPAISGFEFNQIAYGTQGFETFHLDAPDRLRGKPATLRFEVTGGTEEVYLDDVFFKSEHLMLGNPGEARFTRGSNPNSQRFLIERPQYTLSYSNNDKTPNLASWQLNETWLGSGRKDTFHKDDTLPPSWDKVPRNSFGRPWDRGHLTPDAHRNRNLKDEDATFFMTNMIPQDRSNNRGVWSNVEEFGRDIVTDKDKELYIIAGGYGSRGSITRTRDDGTTFNVNIPDRVWKVMVVLDRPGQKLADIDQNTQIIAVDFPNSRVPSGSSRPKWTNYIVDVRTIENRLASAGMNYDLLSNVPREIQNIIETQPFTFPGRRPIDGIV